MSLYYEDGGLRLFHGDNRDVLRTFADDTYASFCTDPPYELGFMGKGWDSTGIAYDVDMWRECLRVLKPGGYLLAFGGTRTWHRLAAAIEDAGFEIRDSIAWMYGQGFPKSLDVSKAIDKANGDPLSFRRFAAAYRVAVVASGLTHADIDRHLGIKASSVYWARDDHRGGLPPRHHWEKVRDLLGMQGDIVRLYDEAERLDREVSEPGANEIYSPSVRVLNAGTPQTDAARVWAGWGTALKPAFEPIIVARKPLAGTVAANVLAYGTGAINIDATRIAFASEADERESKRESKDKNRHADFGTEPGGNTVYGDYSMVERVNYDATGRWPTNVVLDDTQASELDAQTGVSRSRAGKPRSSAAGQGWGLTHTGAEYDDVGGASRFFPIFRYEAKAPGSERPEVDGVGHSTVKPLELMRWLVRLVTRRGGRVLDLFAGSGTTGEAALLEGMEVDLIELEAEHLPLILARVRKPLQPSMFGEWEDAS